MRSKSRILKPKLGLVGLLTAALLMTTGCAKVFNPYDSEFQCPRTDEGRCMSIPDAYEQSLSGENPPPVSERALRRPRAGARLQREAPTVQAGSDTYTRTRERARYDYLSRKYDKMAALIGNPVTPVVAPPDVIRVLILSYTGADNHLFGYRYVYFFATQPRWILSSGKEID